MIGQSPPTSEEIRNALEYVASNGIPAAGAATLLDVGSEPYLAHFRREVLDDLVGTGAATVRIVEGAYGSGKTHLLCLLSELALSHGMAVVRVDLSQAVQLEDWRLITLHVLQNLEARVGGQSVRSLPNILQRLADSGSANVGRIRDAHLQHPGFKNAMQYAADGAHSNPACWELLHRYLLGERVRVGEFQQQGLSGIKDPLSQRNAEYVLNSVLAGLFALGLRGTMLLFDENEGVFVFRGTVAPKRVQVGANLMRRLIDACCSGSLTGAVAVFAVLPDFLQASTLAYPALGQRIEMPRGGVLQPSWRWPAVPVEAVSTAKDAADFLNQAVQRFVDLAARCDVTAADLVETLRVAGDAVLRTNAGTGFRRPLMKRLADLTLELVSGGSCT